MTGRSEPELVALRRLADHLAAGRKEKATTGHLLAAIAHTAGPAGDLLRERRLDVDVLLKAARILTDDTPDAVSRAIQRAREFSARTTAREPAGLHVLFALCQDKGCAAARALQQCGTDVVRLRTAAMQLATGIAPAPRVRPSAPRPNAAAMGMPAPPPSASTPPSPPAPVQQLTMAPSLPALAPPKRSSSSGIAPKKSAASGKKPAAGAAKRFVLDAKRFRVVSQLGRNLTLAAAQGELDPVVGRDLDIERTLDVLAKRHGNCPCLLGPAGVGKTSVVRGLAQRIADGDSVCGLDDRVIVEITPAALLAGTGARGSLAERIAELRAEVAAAQGRVVLFFDEIHALFGPDAGEEATTELKIALSRGELPCIGATTTEEYRRTIENDAALARRFSIVEVDEPSPEEAYLALEGILPAFEKHHDATYVKESLAAAINWSVRYVPSRALPDKAVGILDLAGARTRRRGEKKVTVEQIAEVVSELAHVPMERLLESDGERMLRLEALMAERVVGHTDALGRIAAVLRRNASGFRSRRPIGSFLLLGPTGVGKTETAKAIAECLFHSPDAMTRLDMSEYAESHAIARLFGAPPGYVGHESGGQLTEAVRRRPYQVLLLDEIEKAHRDVLESFLQVLDEGRLTDGRGRTVDLTNTVILMTSNLGAEISPDRGARGRVGFAPPSRSTSARDTEYRSAVVAAARAALPPELYNRIDEVLAFAPLGKDDVREVARRMLAALGEELARARGVRLDASEAALDALLTSGGFDPELGARPMRRAIARLVEAPIAEMLLRGEIARGDVVTVDAEHGTIVVDAVTPSTSTHVA
ncbi:MAG TPA: ATP-dependent Clp protease ATP-binding subunit [Polyangiaceae bacterium]|nr:ATP-dependent Clp protease ATP-binding subunit [Polyangiaceae bacterium]